jgi:hypothetical protein
LYYLNKNNKIIRKIETERKQILVAKMSDEEKLNKVSESWLIVLAKEILYNSLAQATVKLFKKTHISVKLILFLFIMSPISLASYMIVNVILDYYSYEVITTSRVIYETPTLFPKVTLCNQNMFTTKKAFEFAESFNVSWNIYKNRNFMKEMKFTERSMTREQFYELVSGDTFKSNFSDENRRMLGHNFEDILLSCYFNNQVCNSSHFKWKFDPSYGNCYEFNSDENNIKQSTIPGWINGLILELYVNFNENLNEFNSVNGGLGAIVRLDNSSYLIDHGWSGVQVAAGFTNFIALDRSFKFMLPKPYSNCEIDSESPKYGFNSELLNLIAQSDYEYTQELCFEQCYQREALRECGFADSNFLSLFNQKLVETNEAYECVNGIYLKKYSSLDFLNKICLPLCPLECNRTEYKATVTTSQLIGDIYVDYIKGNKNLTSDFINRSIISDTAARSIVKINIFYESLSYTLVTESPKMNVVSMLASIGGNLSLFLGISVFSLFEVVELLTRIYFIKTINPKQLVKNVAHSETNF